MTDWTPVPEPITWDIAPGIEFGGLRYTAVTLRAPTCEEIMKATAVRGASNLEVNQRLVAAVSGVPYEVVRQLPEWRVTQMVGYFEEFAGAPAPDPLEAWRVARRVAAAVAFEAEALAAKATAAAGTVPAS